MRMRSKEFLERIRRELLPLRSYGRAVVLYGSVLTGEFIPGRSDIDVAVVTMKRSGNRVFELLPLYVKAEVIKNYAVVFGDEGEVGEYFYSWRKLCRDFERRREKVTLEDLKAGRERLRRLCPPI